MNWWEWTLRSFSQDAGEEEVGIVEGDYNTWTWKWTKAPSDGIGTLDDISVLIDEKNEVLNIAYQDNSNKNRFAIYNISDFSSVYEAPSGSHYLYAEPNAFYNASIHQGYVYFYSGGISQSVQTYLLLMRDDNKTVEVWRGGSAALWSRDVSLDHPTLYSCDGGAISATGKYVLTGIMDSVSPYLRYIMLYEGSKV